MKHKTVIGRYNKKGTFRLPVPQKVDGLEKVTYIDGGSVWCGVLDIKGREFFEAMAAQAENTVRFELRQYVAGVNTDWRFRVDGVDYDISTIIDPGLEHKKLILVCKAVV